MHGYFLITNYPSIVIVHHQNYAQLISQLLFYETLYQMLVGSPSTLRSLDSHIQHTW